MKKKKINARKTEYVANVEELIRKLNLKMKYVNDIVPRGHVVDIVGIQENEEGKEYGTVKTVDIQKFYEALGVEQEINPDRDEITFKRFGEYHKDDDKYHKDDDEPDDDKDNDEKIEYYKKNGLFYSMN
ncbi:MAG: hypothetical protein ACOCQD_04885 [archaeon]